MSSSSSKVRVFPGRNPLPRLRHNRMTGLRERRFTWSSTPNMNRKGVKASSGRSRMLTSHWKSQMRQLKRSGALSMAGWITALMRSSAVLKYHPRVPPTSSTRESKGWSHAQSLHGCCGCTCRDSCQSHGRQMTKNGSDPCALRSGLRRYKICTWVGVRIVFRQTKRPSCILWASASDSRPFEALPMRLPVNIPTVHHSRPVLSISCHVRTIFSRRFRAPGELPLRRKLSFFPANSLFPWNT